MQSNENPVQEDSYEQVDFESPDPIFDLDDQGQNTWPIFSFYSPFTGNENGSPFLLSQEGVLLGYNNSNGEARLLTPDKWPYKPIKKHNISKEALSKLLIQMGLYSQKQEIIDNNDEFISLPFYTSKPFSPLGNFIITKITKRGVIGLASSLQNTPVFISFKPTDDELEDDLQEKIYTYTNEGTLFQFLDYHFDRSEVTYLEFFKYLAELVKRLFPLDAANNVKPIKLITDWIKAKRAEIAEIEEGQEDKPTLSDQKKAGYAETNIDSYVCPDKETLLIKTEPLSGFDQVIAIHNLFSETLRDIAICAERNTGGEKVEKILNLLPLINRGSTGKIARKASDYITSAKANSDGNSSDTTNGMANKDLLTQIALMNFRAMVDQSTLDLFDSKAIERHFLSTIQSFKYESQELHYLHSLNDFRNTLETNWFQSHQEIDAIWSWTEKYDEGVVSILIHEAYNILKAFEKVSEIIERTIKRSAYSQQILQNNLSTEAEPQSEATQLDTRFIVAFRKAMRNLDAIDHAQWFELNKIQYQLINDIEKAIITHPDVGKALLKRRLRECLTEQPHAESSCKAYQKKIEEAGSDDYDSNLEWVRESYYEIENAIGAMLELLVDSFPPTIDMQIMAANKSLKISDLFDRFVNRFSDTRREVAYKRKQTEMQQKKISLSSNAGSLKLSLRQVAYLYRYSATVINELNKDEIATKYSYSSGYKLLNEHYLVLATETQRLAGRDAIKNIRSVIKYLEAMNENGKALLMAKTELLKAESRKT